MTDGLHTAPPDHRLARRRIVACGAGVALWVFFLLPQVAHVASRYEFIESLQFCVFAFVVPCLLVLGAPWRLVGLESFSHVLPTMTGRNRVLVLSAIFVATDIFWRTAFMVDLLARRPLFDGVQAVSFLFIGVAFFSEMVESPPIRPLVSRVQRLVTAAVVMWTTWIMAYLQGMSGHSWYGVFRKVVGRQLSMANDQQLATFSIWLVAAAVFLPIIFSNIIHWLQDEDRLEAKSFSFGGVEH